MDKVCKKCGYERKQSDVSPEYECPKCGIIYEKVEKYLNEKDEAEEIRKIRERLQHEKIIIKEEERKQKYQQEWERKRKEYQSKIEQSQQNNKVQNKYKENTENIDKTYC